MVSIDPDEENTDRKNVLAPLEAPTETVNPLGQHVTLLSAVMLNLGQLIGSGVYAVPGTLLSSLGSVGMTFIFWIISPLFAFAGLLIYSELASLVPSKRSGAEVVYLEQIYPRPRFLVSTTYAMVVVLTGFSATNAIVFSQYALSALEVPSTAFNQTAVALTVTTLTFLGVALSTKWSLRAVNVLSTLKVISLAFIVMTGIAVLAGWTRISEPYKNFHNLFQGSNFNLNSLATSLIKTNHSFIGWQNSFNVLAEVRSTNPVGVVRRAGLYALSIVCVLFLLTNVAYVAAIPREEIRESGQLVAALFFEKVFGNALAARLLPLMVACSCLGNIIAVNLGQARTTREVARQGLLPYPKFFVSTRPFGTPLGPILLKYAMTSFVILIVPAKDAFNFILDLVSYPVSVFACAMCVGVWILRKRRREAGLAPSKYQAWNAVVITYLASCVFLLVMPWVPPERDQADVSFWYATYCVAGIGLLLACLAYYWWWIHLLPRLGGYVLEAQVEESEDGARNTRLVRRYVSARRGEEQPLL